MKKRDWTNFIKNSIPIIKLNLYFCLNIINHIIMNENNFKLGLYQGDVLFYEGVFSCDDYSQQANIDIRSLIPDYIRDLQKKLSKKEQCFTLPTSKFDFYNNEHFLIDFYYSFSEEEAQSMLYEPKSVEKNINGKKFTGVEFKLGFYVKNKTIIERDFFVMGFNPMSRYSVDITDIMNDLLTDIKRYVKMLDIVKIYNEYEVEMREMARNNE